MRQISRLPSWAQSVIQLVCIFAVGSDLPICAGFLVQCCEAISKRINIFNPYRQHSQYTNRVVRDRTRPSHASISGNDMELHANRRFLDSSRAAFDDSFPGCPSP